MEFKKLGCRLYAFDANNPKTNKPKFLDYSFVQTVSNRKSLHSPNQMQHAKGARKLCEQLN